MNSHCVHLEISHLEQQINEEHTSLTIKSALAWASWELAVLEWISGLSTFIGI